MPYVYKITNNIVNKSYIGSRTKLNHKSFHDDFWKIYFTSSSVVGLLIEEYGKDSFDVELLKEFESIEECIAYEDMILRGIPKNERVNYLNRNFSAGGSVIKNQTHLMITDGKVYLHFPRDIQIPDGWRVEWSFRPPSNEGKRKFVNPESGEYCFVLPEYAPIGWVSINTYKKLIKTPKKTICITDGFNNTKIVKGGQIPSGWKFGKTCKTKSTGRPKGFIGTTTNTFAINDGITNRFILNGTPIPIGWCRGLIRYKRKSNG